MNFIKIHDNLLTKKECDDVIKCCNIRLKPDRNKEDFTGYDYCDIMDRGEDPVKCFSPVPLRPALRAMETLKNSYIKSFPETNIIDRWGLDYVRFKYWEPGYYFSDWHSEHSCNCSTRVMSFLIYLSDNDSQTEFMRYRNVRTKAGRGIMFPAYFTHEHRGSVCKDGLDRYIVSGYYGFK